MRVAAAVLGALLAACSADAGLHADVASSDAASDVAPSGSDVTPVPVDGATAGPCVPGQGVLYVLSQVPTGAAPGSDGMFHLFSYDPRGAGAFHDIGALTGCDAVHGSGLRGLAVDRNGVAWTTDGAHLIQVRTSDATCIGTTAVSGMTPYGTRVDLETLAWSADSSAAGAPETLYGIQIVSTDPSMPNNTQSELLRLDPTTGVRTDVGTWPEIDGTRLDAFITATSDGRLYSVSSAPSHDMPIQIRQRDPASGAAVGSARSIAFDDWVHNDGVFWGGEFWFFLPTNAGSMVTGVQAAHTHGGDITTLPRVGPPLVPQGVSNTTCAPLVAPG